MHDHHVCTFDGIYEWYCKMFEKLGWMAKAKEYGMTLKVRQYLTSVKELKKCIKDKMDAVHDLDKKDDLKIMMHNSEDLVNAAEKLLAGASITPKVGCDGNVKKQHDATFYGLHKWEKKMFEKLGWMVLAKAHGNNLKIQVYMDSIHRLKKALEQKMDSLEEQDRKADTKILLDNVCILHAAAIILLGVDKSHFSKSKKSSKKSTKKSRTIIKSKKTKKSKKSKSMKVKSKSSKSKKSSKKSSCPKETPSSNSGIMGLF